jgi:hypothetical protein
MAWISEKSSLSEIVTPFEGISTTRIDTQYLFQRQKYLSGEQIWQLNRLANNCEKGYDLNRDEIKSLRQKANPNQRKRSNNRTY